MCIESFSNVLLSAIGPPAGDSPDPLGGAGSVFWLIVFAVMAIGFSFLCSIAEAVLLSVTPSYIATLKEKDQRAAEGLEHLKENIDRPLAAILSLNTIAHTVGAAGVGAQAAVIWGSAAVGWASAVMTFLILILSEIIPKTIGAVYWRGLAPWTARLVRFLIIALYPLVILSDLMTRLIAGKDQEIVTREEVLAMAALSEKGGQLKSDESRVLRNLFRLRSLTAHDIMTPRPVIVAFPEEMSVGEFLERQEKLPVSRVPIYRESIDRVTGFVLKTDILLAQANDKPDTPLRELRRELTHVPAQTSLSILFEVLLKQREHLALVIDEYGGTDGLVTLEDLLETLLGIEIVDEADAVTNMQRLARRQWEQRARSLGLDTRTLERKDESQPATQAGGSNERHGQTRLPG